MRVAVISRVFSKTGGGAESYSVAITEQLARQHEIHVFAQESNHPVTGVTYHRVFCLARKPRWLNQLLFALVTWWQTRGGFDVVHAHENTWHGQIQTIHVRPVRHNLFHKRTGARRLLRWLKVALSPRLMTYVFLEAARFKLQPGRSVVAASETLKEECVQAYPDCWPFLSVVTPGAHLPQQTLTRAEARRALGLPGADPLLLFVANDYARKGLDTLLQAMTQLPVDVQLAVAGNPAHIPRYRQSAENLGLRGRVHFLGSLNELSPAYWAADCLVHPTLEDSFAMVVLEAMAHGLPVVVSGPAHCGISGQLRNGVQALLLDNPREVDGLARRIVHVLQDCGLAAGLRQQGLAFARQHSWEKAALQYETLYRQALTRKNT